MLDKNTINEISRMKIEDLMAIYDYAKGLETVNPALRGLFRETMDTRNLAGLGALLIAIPDPITDVPGVVLLVLAKVIEKNRGASIQEIAREFNTALDELKDIV
ncbi:MAG: hypothetical protein JRN26_01665 [Nitrososphaerota archaeon]|jgi:hypothetical protein|nr:hypothetical protein [Nitrososphaerota archaeon]MDG6930253.1 hypothetical protein [Nitrososphaerota archaeon]MDG6932623.1 hypothetical protein [Nitrososphaerota archaeon]MDG6935585.1 hypothetical protein [Nitrososphaerota archaeon]MDG6944029.1 hypothetical protein [Nitrososphaerota archaeon]